MKKSAYMDRAMRHSDRRFASILGKMGYQTRELRPAPEPVVPVDDIVALRADYERVVGKRPFMGWDAGTLRTKIAEAVTK